MALLYLWQIALLRPHAVHRAAAWLGLYVLSSGDPATVLALRLAHLTALVVLFAALGHYNGGDREVDSPALRGQQRMWPARQPRNLQRFS